MATLNIKKSVYRDCRIYADRRPFATLSQFYQNPMQRLHRIRDFQDQTGKD